MAQFMRLIFLSFALIFSFQLHSVEFDPDLTKIELSNYTPVSNQDIFESSDFAVELAVEDYGPNYNFQKLIQVVDLEITTLYKDSNDTVRGLTLIGATHVGGYAWFDGYQQGWVDCEIHLLRGSNNDWSWDGMNAVASCDLDTINP